MTAEIAASADDRRAIGRAARTSPAHSPALALARLALRGCVAALAVLAQFERVAAAHHRLAEVAALRGAERDAAIMARADRRAGHLAAADQLGERASRGLAAAVAAPLRVAAILAAFRRVDAEQADARVADLQRVAVDRAGMAGYGVAGRLRRLGGRGRALVLDVLRIAAPIAMMTSQMSRDLGERIREL